MRKGSQSKNLSYTSGGFTLIELLVAMIIAAIVIGLLLGFMLNIMDTTGKEQAKATSEQELQTTLDYIARDLEQAVYIYDADGIAAIKSQLPGSTATDRVPVLVFWKREFRQEAFVYSLVAYYLIKNNDSTWSSAARIGRFQITDGVRNPNSSTVTDYLPSYLPDDGFKLFDLTKPGTLKDKMNAWQKDISKSYTVDIVPLVDYIDQSTGSTVPLPVNCTSNISSLAQQVPANGTTANPLGIYSFYACVDSSTTWARVYLRGNALARISKGATYSNSHSTYFPTANVQVQNRGALGVK